MILKTRLQSQRDARWGHILLGYNTEPQYTIYNYGCLITSLGNYIDKQPDEVNQILKDNAGFANGGNFVWSKCAVLGINQTYLSTRCQDVPLYTTEVDKLIGFLHSGFPALCEVDFNPATDPEEQHYVLAVGYTDGEIIVVDPWEGQIENWSFDAFKRNTYQYRVYDKKLSQEEIETMVQVDSKTFENLVRKSTIYDKIFTKLGVTDSETIVMAEIDKLITYEDTVRQQEQQLAGAGTRIKELEQQLADLTAAHEKFKEETNQTIREQGLEISSLSTSLQELKAQAMAKVYSGWKAALIKLVQSLPF